MIGPHMVKGFCANNASASARDELVVSVTKQWEAAHKCQSRRYMHRHYHLSVDKTRQVGGCPN